VRGVAEERSAAADPSREPGEDAQLPFEDLALRGEVQDGEELGVVVLELGYYLFARAFRLPSCGGEACSAFSSVLGDQRN
jgi:hypothetical protein